MTCRGPTVLLFTLLAALALFTGASAAPACSLAAPGACGTTNPLIWDPDFDHALEAFVGPGRWPGNNEFAAGWIENLLGGPPDDQRKLPNGDLLFAACRPHACDVDMAAVIVRPGRILAIGVVSVVTGGAPAASLLFRDGRAAQDLTPALQDWARTASGNPLLAFQTRALPIRLPPGGDCSLRHLAVCKTTEMLNEASDYRGAIKAFVGEGEAAWLDLNPVISSGNDFGFSGSLLDAVQSALGMVEANSIAVQGSPPIALPGGALLFEGHVFQQWGAGAAIVQSGKIVGIGILNYACDKPCAPARVDLLFRSRAQAETFAPALKDWAARAIFGSSDFTGIPPSDRPELVFRSALLPLKGPLAH